MKVVFWSLLLILAFPTLSIGADKIIFKGASVVTDQHPLGYAGKLFKQELEKMTDKIEVQWFPTGQLGGEVQMLNQLQQGVIQFATISCAITGNMNPKLMTMYTPYLILSWDSFMNKWINSEGAKLLHDALRKQGIAGYGWVPYGFNALCYIDPPIRTLEEAKGRKLRAAEAYTIKGTLEALGINSVPLPFSEVYQSLQQKLVEGLTTPPALAMLSRFDEVINNITLSDHLFGTHVFWVNEAAFRKLPKDLQDKFLLAINNACKREQADIQKLDEEAVAKLKAKGIKAWTLSQEEKQRWIKACRKVVIEHEKRVDKASNDGRKFMQIVYKSLGRDYDKEIYGQ